MTDRLEEIRERWSKDGLDWLTPLDPILQTAAEDIALLLAEVDKLSGESAAFMDAAVVLAKTVNGLRAEIERLWWFEESFLLGDAGCGICGGWFNANSIDHKPDCAYVAHGGKR